MAARVRRLPFSALAPFSNPPAEQRQGLNTIGGRTRFAEPDDDRTEVFVKFMDRRQVLTAAVIDQLAEVLGLAPVGGEAILFDLPAHTALPRFKTADARSVRSGAQWAHVADYHAAPTVHEFVAREARIALPSLRRGKEVTMTALQAAPDQFRPLLLAWARALAVRLVLGVPDMGPSNFLVRSGAEGALHVSLIDLGGGFCAEMDPRRGTREMLAANLLQDQAKQALLAVGAGTEVVDMWREWFTPGNRIRERLLLAMEGSGLPAALVDEYVLPNMRTVVEDFGAFLASRSSRGGQKRVADAEEGARKTTAAAAASGAPVAMPATIASANE